MTALGSALFDANARDLGDIDSGMVLMRTESGKLAHVNCSPPGGLRLRPAAGDPRLGRHAALRQSAGDQKWIAGRNPPPPAESRCSTSSSERYADAYVAEIDEFLAAVSEGRAPRRSASRTAGGSLLLADAALESLKTGKTVRV